MSEHSSIGSRKPTATTFERLESSVRSYSRSFPRVFARAQGAKIYADNGDEYLDFLMGCSSLNYGHNHPALKEALVDYIAGDGLTHGLDFFSESKEKFLREFHDTILAPRDLDYVVQFPGPTGANAVEAALKLARKITGRQNVIAFTNGFHGVTLGALACTGNQHHRGGAGVELGGITRMPFDNYFGRDVNTAEYLDRMLSDPSSGIDEPAAIVLETVQGEGGLNAASPEWLRDIASVARRHGALLIVDDVQAGVGRAGSFFSFEQTGIEPDIVTMAKSVSGYGLPMALVLIRREYDQWAPGEHNGTFRGNCHAFVTATAALRTFWQDGNFEREIEARSTQLGKRLSRISKKHSDENIGLPGRSMMRGLRFESGEIAAEVTRNAYKRGLVIETSGPGDEVVKCLAPLTISEDEFDRGLSILEAAVDETFETVQKDAA